MIVGNKRAQCASIAPQMARAVFIPPTYPDQASRQGGHQPLHRDRRGAASVRQSVSSSVRQFVSSSVRQFVSSSVRQFVSSSAYQPGYTRLPVNKNGSLDGSRDEGTLARAQPWLAGSSWAENSRMKASARSTILVDPTK